MPATAQVRIGADTKEFKRAMDGINASLGKIGKNAKGLSGILGGTLGMLKKIGAVSVFGGVPAGLLAAQKAFNKFEHNMLEVYTLLPRANRSFFQTMKKDALAFSEAYGRMPEEVAKGMYQAISAGTSPTGLTEGFLAVAQKSAIAGVTDMKTAVDALTNVTNSYGEGTYDVSQVADQMFTAVSMSKTTFRELADYMYQILPTAGSLNVRLDDLLGSISALASTGTLTRVGTTQLRQMLIEMSRMGDKSQQAFLSGTGGVPLEEFIKRGGRLVDVIQIMAKVAEKRKVSIRNLFGSVEAGNAATTLANSKKFANMVAEIEEGSGGMMGRAFDKMSSSQKIRIDKIARTFMNSFIKVGEVIRPMIDDIITYFEGRAKALQEFDWEGLATKFKDVWFKIKKIIASGEGWEFFLLNAKIAIKKVLIQIRQLTDYWSAQFGIALNGGSSGWSKMTNALIGIASAFWDKFETRARDAGVVLLNAFAPALAFAKAALQQIAYDANPLNAKTSANKVSSARRSDMKGFMEERDWDINELLNTKRAAREAYFARVDMRKNDPDNIGEFYDVPTSQARAMFMLGRNVNFSGTGRQRGRDYLAQRGISQKDLDSLFGKQEFWKEGTIGEQAADALVGNGRMYPVTGIASDIGIAEGLGGPAFFKMLSVLTDLSNRSPNDAARQWAGELHQELVDMRAAQIEGMQIAASQGRLDKINPAFGQLSEHNAKNMVLLENYRKNMAEHQWTIKSLTKWRDQVRPREEKKSTKELNDSLELYREASKELAAEIKDLRENGMPIKSEVTKRLEASVRQHEQRVAELWAKYNRPMDDEEGIPDDGGNIVEDGERIAKNDYTMQAVQQVPMVADSKAKVGGGGGVWTGRYTPLDKNNDLLKENTDAIKENTKGRDNSVTNRANTQDDVSRQIAAWDGHPMANIYPRPETSTIQYRAGLRALKAREELNSRIRAVINPYRGGSLSKFNAGEARSGLISRYEEAAALSRVNPMPFQELMAKSDAEYLFAQDWNRMMQEQQNAYVKLRAAADDLREGSVLYRNVQKEAAEKYPRVTVDEVLNFQ